MSYHTMSQNKDAFAIAAEIIESLQIPRDYWPSAYMTAWHCFGQKSVRKALSYWWSHHEGGCEEVPEMYCPICGELDPRLIYGLHECDGRKASEEWFVSTERPYGEQLADGFYLISGNSEI